MIPYLPKPTDFWVHIEYAKRLKSLADIESPHFLFELLLIAGTRLTRLSFESFAIVLMALSYAGMAAMIAGTLRRAAPKAGTLALVAVSVLVLVASHIFLQ